MDDEMTNYGTYVCAKCGGTFEKMVPDEEADAEARKIFGAVTDDMALVCDDCFQALEQRFQWKVKRN
jgi:rubredoxin